jgi:hypothetical protein
MLDFRAYGVNSYGSTTDRVAAVRPIAGRFGSGAGSALPRRRGPTGYTPPTENARTVTPASIRQRPAKGRSMAGTMSSRWRSHSFGRVVVAIALLVCLVVPVAAIAQDTSNPAKSIAGTYTVVLTIADVPKDLTNGPALYGRWQISFRTDGTYATERADIEGEMASGTYTVDGNKLSVTDKAGLLSCANASIVGNQTDAATGTYTWNRNNDTLSLIPIEDKCEGRRILFSTRPMAGYVPCATQPLNLTASGSPEAEASPSGATSTPQAAPSTPTVSNIAAASASPAAEGPIPKAIDALLSQMTSCWATGRPELFLPLLTSSYRAQLLQGTTSTDPIAALATLMASTPYVWQRAGDVSVVDATHATALVRQAVNTQEDFVRYAFALEDGAWRWNGAG